MADELSIKENELFTKWRQTQNPVYFQQLYSSMKPLIVQATKKATYGSNVPQAAHQIWAAQNFLDALRTFDPKAGAALKTHVYGAVHQKAKRLNYMYQNLGHIPEHRIQAVGTYHNENQFLKEKLGREPSAAELADRLGWGVSDVASIRKELRKDLAMGEGTEDVPFFQSNRDEEILNFLYYDLTPPEKSVYEYLYGKQGHPKLIKESNRPDYDKIASRLGMSTSKVRSIVAGIQVKLEKALKK